MKRTALLVTAIFASSTPAMADPGHGMVANLVHLLTEPDHLAILALVAGAAWFTLRRLRAKA